MHFNAVAAVFVLVFVANFYNILGVDDADSCSYDKYLENTSKELVSIPSDTTWYKFNSAGKSDPDEVDISKDPVFFWLEFPDTTDGNLRMEKISQDDNRMIIFEPYGSPGCRKTFNDTKRVYKNLLDGCDCKDGLKNLYQGKFMAVRMWLESGTPIRVNFLKDDDLKIYLFKEDAERFNVSRCPNYDNVLKEYEGRGYIIFSTATENNPNGPFQVENGEHYVYLNNTETVVWVEAKDFEPHILVIKAIANESKEVEVGVEAFGQRPDITVLDDYMEDGLHVVKMKVENKICSTFFIFVGYIRYVITVNEQHLLKATFQNSNTTNLPLYWLPYEEDGKPMKQFATASYYNFAMNLTSPFPLPPTTTTTTTPMPSSTVSNAIAPSSTPTQPLLESSTVNSGPPTKSPLTNEISTTPASWSTTLIVIIVISTIIALIILIIAIVCIVLCRRRRKLRLQNAPNGIAQGPSAAENAPARNKKSAAPPPPVTGNIDAPLPIPLPQTTQPILQTLPSSALVASKNVPASNKPKPPVVPEPMLDLKKTQSYDSDSSKFGTFSRTRRDAKYAKRDPRFPHLIPNTPEFMAADRSEGKVYDRGPKSGTIDDSKLLPYLHSH